MKRLLFVSVMILSTVGTGCSLSAPQVMTTVDILSQDITGDGIEEVLTITKSQIELDPVFLDVYPYVFTELHITDGDRDILTITNEGIGVEDGEIIPATIPDSDTYAMQLGEADFMYVVQLDNSGAVASEPLTINFDIETQQWIMGK